MHGVLNIDKPAGMTSMDVVRRIKRASRQKRVGHGGTLDPIATGVVAICLGQATRMMEYLIDDTRHYAGQIELGVETDTYDAMGEVTSRKSPAAVTLQDVEHALEAFKGDIEQVPPMYSALKIQGRRLYHLARAGVEVERAPRKMQVSEIEILDWTPPVVAVEVACGRGFYMRSLAYDLGQTLGCGGHLKALTRLRTGPFKLSDALALEEAEQRLQQDGWEGVVSPPDMVVRHLRAAIVGEQQEEMIRHGRPLPAGLRIPFSRPDERCRAYALDGTFIAVLYFNASRGQWQPDRVFPRNLNK